MQTLTKTLLLLFCLLHFNAFSQYKVTISDNYPPYNFKDSNGEITGFVVDILKAINTLYESEFEIETGAWDEINQKLEKGEIQAIGGANYPGYPDREYLYTRSLANTSHCFLYNRNFVKKITPEFIRTAHKPLICLYQNDVLVHYIQSLNPDAEFLYVNNYTDLINSLDRKEVTCAISKRTRGLYFADELGKDYIYNTSHSLLEQSIGFKVSRSAPELAKMLNNGLEVIMANGEYNRIYDKWIASYDRERNNWNAYLKYIVIIGILALVSILLLMLTNRILKVRVRIKTYDLQHQLELNSQIMAELKEQKQKAVESEKMKSAFLANMSHEIRTPMNGILGFADLLKEHAQNNEEQLQFIDIIRQSGERMLTTINNIIEISKIEAGVEKIKITGINFREMVQEWEKFFTIEAKQKGIGLYFIDKNPDSHGHICTDEHKLNSIGTNLIKNAIKFTKAGSVTVEFEIKPEELYISVSDTGIGIPKEKQKMVFDQFVQADASHSSGFEGSGLGLSISNAYVNLMQGSIRLQSATGKGSAFFVTLPNLRETGNDCKKTEQNGFLVKNISPNRLKILIAEDDDISYNLLAHVLKDIAAEIKRARNGKEIVELIKLKPDTDLILMDMKMPEMSGESATREIRTFNTAVCIIGQTADSEDSGKHIFLKAGCNACVEKPINRKKLLQTIQTCLIHTEAEL
ncbi:MAG: ATP-binding protein [Draconibacterium sp.]